jgi:hypothetical protein
MRDGLLLDYHQANDPNETTNRHACTVESNVETERMRKISTLRTEFALSLALLLLDSLRACT